MIRCRLWQEVVNGKNRTKSLFEIVFLDMFNEMKLRLVIELLNVDLRTPRAFY